MYNYIESFVFNGISSKKMGLMICDFNSSSGLNNSSAGSKIEMKTSKAPFLNRWNHNGTEYTEQLSYEISACKYGGEKFTKAELASITRWLVRKDGFKPMKLDGEDFYNIVFQANATSIEKLNVCGNTVGITITFVCDSPFGYSNLITKTKQINTGNESFNIKVDSDEIGYVYPSKTEIIIKNDCNLEILNNTTGETVKINNCLSNEKIILDSETKQIISSSDRHNITLQDDFNWKWFRIMRDEDNISNNIQVSHPCTIIIEYQGIKKVGV